MKKRNCFIIRVCFSYSTPNKNKTISTTQVYRIVTDSKDDACDTARNINNQEYGYYFMYQCVGLAVLGKEFIYVLDK